MGTPEFRIELNGNADEAEMPTTSDFVSLKKQMLFGPGSIAIDTDSFSKDTPQYSSVGTLSVPGNTDGYTYNLIEGAGDTDNALFSIENDLLKTNTIFKDAVKNTLSLRIAAANKTSGATIEDNLILNITGTTEKTILGPCVTQVEKLAYALNDVAYIGNEEVVAIGTEGIILKSYDGGQTWVKKHTEANRRLHHLQFVDNKVSYIIGEYDILKTEDGGEHWFSLEFPDQSYPFPHNLFFVNADLGFVFGGDGKIYKTTDGGKYWRKSDMGFENYSAGYFLNEITGFICGGNENSILKTVNAGESWNRYP